MSTPTPWQVLDRLMTVDRAAPRVTFYERTPGPTQGERVELSAKVLTNWVSKAANLLSEEFDVDASSSVLVHLPAAHWRTVYWCLAAWSLGATVVFVDADTRPELPAPSSAGDAPEPSALMTSNPADAFDGDVVVVTLAMLARASSADLPAGSIDEARELSTYGDVFTPFEAPAPTATAFVVDDRRVSFGELVDQQDGDASRRVHLCEPAPDAVIRVLAGGGGVVVVRGEMADDELARVLEQESALSE